MQIFTKKSALHIGKHNSYILSSTKSKWCVCVSVQVCVFACRKKLFHITIIYPWYNIIIWSYEFLIINKKKQTFFLKKKMPQQLYIHCSLWLKTKIKCSVLAEIWSSNLNTTIDYFIWHLIYLTIVY